MVGSRNSKSSILGRGIELSPLSIKRSRRGSMVARSCRAGAVLSQSARNRSPFESTDHRETCLASAETRG